MQIANELDLATLLHGHAPLKRLVWIVLIVGGGLISGCAEQNETISAEIDYERFVQMASESHYLIYTDRSSVVKDELWLPENEEGLTRIEFRGEPSSNQVSHVVLFSGDEIIGEVRSGPNNELLGTVATLADGSGAILEAVEGDDWTWEVTDSEGNTESKTVTAPPPPTAMTAGDYITPPVHFASQDPGRPGSPIQRTAKVVQVEAVASVEFYNPDGVPDADLRNSRFSRSCTTSRKGSTCDTDLSPVNGNIYVYSWAETDLSDLSSNEYWVYDTEAECRAEQSEHNWEGVGIGMVLTVIGAALAAEAPVITVGAASFGPVGAFVAAGGILTSVAFNLAMPVCSGLRTNERLIADAFARFDDTQITASWNWLPFGPTYSIDVDPRGASIQPFLSANRGGMTLPQVSVTFRSESDEEASGTIDPPSDWATYVGEIGPGIISRPVASSNSPLTIEIDPNGLARISVNMTIRTSYESRAGCWMGDGEVGHVPLMGDGSFNATLSFRGNYHDGPNRGDPCAELKPEESVIFAISGRIDAESGTGSAVVGWQGGSSDVALVRQ